MTDELAPPEKNETPRKKSGNSVQKPSKHFRLKGDPPENGPVFMNDQDTRSNQLLIEECEEGDYEVTFSFVQRDSAKRREFIMFANRDDLKNIKEIVNRLLPPIDEPEDD